MRWGQGGCSKLNKGELHRGHGCVHNRVRFWWFLNLILRAMGNHFWEEEYDNLHFMNVILTTYFKKIGIWKLKRRMERLSVESWKWPSRLGQWQGKVDGLEFMFKIESIRTFYVPAVWLFLAVQYLMLQFCVCFSSFPLSLFVWHANSHLAFKAWLRSHHYHNMIWCIHLACSLFINCFFNQFYYSQTLIAEWRSEWMIMNFTH